METSLLWLARIARWEGYSYLLLLLVAMPLKYLLHKPQAVQIVGMAHGWLFVAFCAALALVFFRHRWPLSRVALAFACSLVPFGTFWLEHKLRQDWHSSR